MEKQAAKPAFWRLGGCWHRPVLQWHDVSVWQSQRFGGVRLQFGASLLSVEKATSGSGSRRLMARSVLQWHVALLGKA
jgi:hypothetical protein